MMFMGFDQAPKFTGWAAGPADPSARVQWGTIVGSDYGDDDQRMMFDFARDVGDVLDRFKPAAIFFEQIVIKKHAPNLTVAYKQFAISTTLQFVAMQRGIPAYMVLIADWRKRFLGRSNRPKHAGSKGPEAEWLKEAAKQECLKRGYLTANDHEAEAIGILDYGIASQSVDYRFATKADVERRQQRARKENMENR